jgi:hypothetical protein
MQSERLGDLGREHGFAGAHLHAGMLRKSTLPYQKSTVPVNTTLYLQ